jgi:hypothetical protein
VNAVQKPKACAPIVCAVPADEAAGWVGLAGCDALLDAERSWEVFFPAFGTDVEAVGAVVCL